MKAVISQAWWYESECERLLMCDSECSQMVARQQQDVIRTFHGRMCLVRLPFTVCLCDPDAAAVDLWSVGVILLCILSGRYPFFRAQDDLTAFIQIMRLLGTVACKEAAKALGEHSWARAFMHVNCSGESVHV